jgi:hypothetical protein
MEDQNKNEDLVYNADGKVDLDKLLTGVMQKFLGKALDYGRISGMSDRSFAQFQRSIKDDHYTILSYALKILEDSGHIKSNGTR